MKGPVLHILAGDLWGGREAQLEVQLRALRLLDWDVQVLLFNAGEVQTRYASAGIPVIVAEESAGFVSLINSAKRQAAALSPKLVVGHGYKESVLAWRIAAMLGIPWVSVFHGAREQYRGFAELRMRLYELIAKTVTRLFAPRIVCVSKALAGVMKFSGEERLRIIYNARTTPDLAINETASRLSARPAVIVIGRLVQVKRVDRVIDVQRRLQRETNAHLYIVGSGPQQDALKKLATDSGVSESVHFLGFRKDANELLADCDVLLISSDSEGIPTVLLDAIQFGVPVVSTAVGGIPEVMSFFPEYPARLVRPDDPGGLAAAVMEFLEKRPAAPAGRLAVLERFFSAERAAEAHDALYRELIDV